MALIAQGVNTAEDLRSAANDPARLERIRTAWQKVPGQGSGITWHYAQMLAGVPGVKPDRMIIRFVAKALGLPPRRVKPQFALEAVKARPLRWACRQRISTTESGNGNGDTERCSASPTEGGVTLKLSHELIIPTSAASSAV